MSTKAEIGAVANEHRNDDILARAYRQHWHPLCRYLRATFGAGPPEPEDIAQAAFTKLAAIDDPASILNPGAFLRRAAHNLAIDAQRHNGRTRRIEKNLEIFASENGNLSPEDVLASKEELERLNNVIARLKPKYRVALMLHRMDGLNYVEIANEMGISVSGARLLVNTALARCAAVMGSGRQ